MKDKVIMDKVTMDNEVKAEWVKRLRSGEYQQGSGFLKSRNRGEDKWSHCCLGVLCEIYAEKKGLPGTESRLSTQVSEDDVESTYFLDNDVLLSSEIRNWAGLPWGHGANVLIGKESTALAALTDHNDNGRTFNEIADAIEAQL